MRKTGITIIRKPPYRRRIVCLSLSLAMLLISLMSLFGGAALASSPGVAIIQIQQTFTFTGSPPGNLFTYELVPASFSNPMPSHGGMFTIVGTRSLDLNITFTSGGIYTYELSHVTAPATGYRYDNRVYVIDVHVAGGSLNTAITVTNKQTGDKVASLAYNHTYTPLTPPPVSPGPPGPPGSPGPPGPPGQVNPPSPPGPKGPHADPVASPTPTPKHIPGKQPPLGDISGDSGSGGTGANLGEPPSPPTSGEGSTDAWSLLNMVMAVVGIMMGIVTGMRVLLLSKKEGDEIRDRAIYEDEESGREEYKRERRRMEEYAQARFVWLVVTLIMASIGIIVFILTEDMRLPMILVDRWTVIHAIVITIEIVAGVFASRRTEYNEYYCEDESLPHLS